MILPTLEGGTIISTTKNMEKGNEIYGIKYAFVRIVIGNMCVQ